MVENKTLPRNSLRCSTYDQEGENRRSQLNGKLASPRAAKLG
jgi:hypothetical protein